MPGQRTPAGFKFEDMAFMPQSYGMGMPPMQENDRMLGAVNALAMFAGTLAGNNQVIDVAQKQWLQRERQRTVSHQRSMMMQAAQNKLAFETEQANLDRTLKALGPIWRHAQTGAYDPTVIPELINARTGPEQVAAISAMLPGTPIPGEGMPMTPFRDTALQQERIEQGKGLAKLDVRETAIDMGIAAAEIGAVAPAEAEAAELKAQTLQPIKIATAGGEAAARTGATISTKAKMIPQLKDITAATTQQAQPKPPEGPASKTRAKYEKDFGAIWKTKAASYDKMTGNIKIDYQDIEGQDPNVIAQRAYARDQAIRMSAWPEFNAKVETELRILSNQPDEIIQAELKSGAAADLLSRIQPGPPPREPDLTHVKTEEKGAQLLRAWEQAKQAHRDQGQHFQYVAEQVYNLLKRFGQAD